MTEFAETTVDFVARGASPHEWRLVLVEQGPWKEPYEEHLRTLQNRLYGCIDAVLEGKVAEKYPESERARIVIQIDGYDLPDGVVRDFFGRFSNGVFSFGDYKAAMEQSLFASAIEFALSLKDTA